MKRSDGLYFKQTFLFVIGFGEISKIIKQGRENFLRLLGKMALAGSVRTDWYGYFTVEKMPP